MKNLKSIACIFLVIFLIPLLEVQGQDAAKIDPEHYKVVVENDKVRVLRINYAPGEESQMHSHPEGVAVFLSDFKANMKLENGESIDMMGEAGDVLWTGASKHKPKNTGDKAFEVVQVELKNGNTNYKKKSLHLFELPEGVSEQQLSEFLKEMNSAISSEGYPDAGYHLYKITTRDDKFAYFMEGVWPDSETYDKIHESEGWKSMAEKGKTMIEKIQANELYLKAEKIE